MSARRFHETDILADARLIAVGLASIGIEVQIVRGHTHRYLVRERVRWDRAFLVWRKRFSRGLRGITS